MCPRAFAARALVKGGSPSPKVSCQAKRGGTTSLSAGVVVSATASAHAHCGGGCRPRHQLLTAFIVTSQRRAKAACEVDERRSNAANSVCSRRRRLLGMEPRSTWHLCRQVSRRVIGRKTWKRVLSWDSVAGRCVGGGRK